MPAVRSTAQLGRIGKSEPVFESRMPSLSERFADWLSGGDQETYDKVLRATGGTRAFHGPEAAPEVQLGDKVQNILAGLNPLNYPFRWYDTGAHVGEEYLQGNLNNAAQSIAMSALVPPALKQEVGAVEHGLGRVGTGPAAEAPKMRVYHSSPYDFDRFDITKIGTGEAGHSPSSPLETRSGSGAFGAGIYTAESPGVRDFYRESLARGNDPRDLVTSIRQDWEGASSNPITAESAAKMMQQYDELRPFADDKTFVGHVVDYINGGRYGNVVTDQAMFALRAMDKKLPPPPKAKTYEVDLRARPEDFLDQDAPLAGQPAWEKIKAHWDKTLGDPDIIMQRAGLTEQSLGSDYMRLGNSKAAAAARAEELRQAGVPGSRYFDEFSRRTPISGLTREQAEARIAGLKRDIASGGGDQEWMKRQLSNLEHELEKAGPATRNYLVVNTDIMEIVRKYGIAGALAAGAINQMQADQLTEQGYQ